MLYTIGEFSRITQLSVKALRHYHEKGLIIPDKIDSDSGYRFYHPDQVEEGRRIVLLKKVGFSLEQISEIIRDCQDEQQLRKYLEKQRTEIALKIDKNKRSLAEIDQMIELGKAESIIMNHNYTIEEKQVAEILMVGHRMVGKYEDIGIGFQEVSSFVRGNVSGKPFTLHYCEEYRENDAEFEACFPVKRKIRSTKAVDCRMLPGGKVLSLIHRGPYDQLHRSYQTLIDEIKSRGVSWQVPAREIYLKGPGMVFKGNPGNYLTEIQFMIDA